MPGYFVFNWEATEIYTAYISVFLNSQILSSHALSLLFLHPSPWVRETGLVHPTLPEQMVPMCPACPRRTQQPGQSRIAGQVTEGAVYASPTAPGSWKGPNRCYTPLAGISWQYFFLSENRKYFLPTQDYNCSVPLISTFTVERSFSSKADREYSQQTDSAPLRLLTQ